MPSARIDLGHEVFMGSRKSENDKLKIFEEKHKGKARTGTFAEAAAFAELIFNCSKGDATLEIFKNLLAETNGKIVVDVANPLDYSGGVPPSLVPSLSNTNSLGEALQKTLPDAYVVKTLNTMWCGIMVNPNVIGQGDHVNFICGNHAEAKTKVKKLLQEFGWKEKNLLDLGDISNARGTEAVLPIWLRVWNATQNGAFNFKIVS